MSSASQSLDDPQASPPGDADALKALLAQVRLTDDYRQLQSLCRKRRKMNGALPAEPRRIAILGGATTDYMEELLKLELESLGIGSDIRSSDYNTITFEILNPDSQTIAFEPNIAVLLPTPFNLMDWPATAESAERVEALVEQTCDHWLGLCATLHERTNCDVVLGNFHLLPTNMMGNLGCRHPWDRNCFIRQVNATLSRRAPGYVHIFDIDTLSSYYGVNNWFDPRYWHHAKQPVSFDCLAPFVRKLGAVISAIYGKIAKCLVLDLDNTLWGGVVGDDGVDGVKIGENDAEGEAFKAFQEYILGLKDRGLLLAVSSKNDPDIARLPFQQREDMVLSLDDFVAFKAGWNPKPQSVMQIAEQLNIGMDSIVFVDDNPVERALMRDSAPEVKVVELSADPAEYPYLLERSGWLEFAQFTAEDRQKTAQYKQNAERQELLASHDDYEKFLESLDQKAVVGDFAPEHLDRITQLINKTNQFNLTTKRMTRSEVEEVDGRESALGLFVRLTDRFGDNGIISVLIADRDRDALNVDVWLMSCRVLKRGVEHMLANVLVERAKAMGAGRICGDYRPTAKNKLVKDLYPELGFVCETEEPDGTTTWSLDVANYEPFPVQISIVDDLA